MAHIFAGPGGAVVGFSASGGKVTRINTLGTSAAQVIASNPQRRKLVFHNPGTIDCYVAPMVDANGASFTPAAGSLGGTFLVYANGGTLILEGEIQGAWQAFMASGSNQPLTIMDANV